MNLRTSELEQIKRLLNRKSIDSERQRRQSPFLTMFPDTGPWLRQLYPSKSSSSVLSHSTRSGCLWLPIGSARPWLARSK
jgi:hypothetical protein